MHYELLSILIYTLLKRNGKVLQLPSIPKGWEIDPAISFRKHEKKECRRRDKPQRLTPRELSTQLCTWVTGIEVQRFPGPCPKDFHVDYLTFVTRKCQNIGVEWNPRSNCHIVTWHSVKQCLNWTNCYCFCPLTVNFNLTVYQLTVNVLSNFVFVTWKTVNLFVDTLSNLVFIGKKL